MFRVRPVQWADHSQWFAMRAALWPELPGDTDPETRTYFHDGRIAGVPHGVFVAERLVDAHLIGFIELSLHDAAPGVSGGPVGFVEGWYVDAAARRTGAGRALLQAGEAWCQARGCVAMASDTTRAYADASIPAHLACGFRIHRGHLPEPDGAVHFIKVNE